MEGPSSQTPTDTSTSKRSYQWSAPIQANYYPIVYGAYIRDNAAQLTFISERSHGGSSLSEGQLEVMVHRNPDMSDGFGPGLTDTTEVYPTLRVLVDTPQASPKAMKRQNYLLNYPFGLYSAATTSINSWMSNYRPIVKFLSQDVPANIHLQSLNALDTSTFKTILRIVHIFADGEDPVLSQPVVVDIGATFSTFQISSVVETTVSGNAVINANPGSKIMMNPADIRTFIVTFA